MKPAIWSLLSYVILFLTLVALPMTAVKNTRDFEDYLTKMDVQLQEAIVKLAEDSGTSQQGGSPDWGVAVDPGQNQNLTCCLLGEIAGSKGFHCYVDFYVARIMIRNRNRAHSRKLGFYGRYRVAQYGKRLMTTFEQCVAGHVAVFHRCCHLAAATTRQPNVTSSETTILNYYDEFVE